MWFPLSWLATKACRFHLVQQVTVLGRGSLFLANPNPLVHLLWCSLLSANYILEHLLQKDSPRFFSNHRLHSNFRLTLYRVREAQTLNICVGVNVC